MLRPLSLPTETVLQDTGVTTATSLISRSASGYLDQSSSPQASCPRHSWVFHINASRPGQRSPVTPPRPTITVAAQRLIGTPVPHNGRDKPQAVMEENHQITNIRARQNQLTESHTERTPVAHGAPDKNRGYTATTTAWSTKANRALLRHAKTGKLSGSQIAQILTAALGIRVTTGAVCRKAREHGLSMPIPPKPLKVSAWPEEAILQLRRFAQASELSASKIAKALTAAFGIPISRGAVMGKAWRLGLVIRPNRHWAHPRFADRPEADIARVATTRNTAKPLADVGLPEQHKQVASSGRRRVGGEASVSFPKAGRKDKQAAKPPKG